MFLRKNKHKCGSAFMEYAIILGVASLVLVTMNIYTKRGVQGKIKDMSDYFISEGIQVQEGEANAGAITTSNSRSTANSNYNIAQRLGGARIFVLQDSTDTSGDSRSVEEKKNIVPESAIDPDEGEGVVPDVVTSRYGGGGTPEPEPPSGSRRGDGRGRSGR